MVVPIAEPLHCRASSQQGQMTSATGFQEGMPLHEPQLPERALLQAIAMSLEEPQPGVNDWVPRGEFDGLQEAITRSQYDQ